MCCWQCQFFLHKQCFLASRSLNHPSHLPHLLALFPSPTYPSGSFICNSCNLSGTGFFYSCPNCEFDLHVHCAYNIMPQTTTPTSYHSLPPQPNFNPQFAKPNDTGKKPRGAKHFSHDHPLHLAELREVDKIICSGCQNCISVSGYRCSKIPSCKFYLHKARFELPREIKHKSHHPNSNPLALLCSPPYKEDGIFTCNACLSSGTAFSYHCSACNFDLHVRCAFLPETVKSGDHNHPSCVPSRSRRLNTMRM